MRTSARREKYLTPGNCNCRSSIRSKFTGRRGGQIKNCPPLSLEPLQRAKDKRDLKKFYSLEIPKSYNNCTEDIALPPEEWGWYPCNCYSSSESRVNRTF